MRKITLEELVPAESKLVLSKRPNTNYTLCEYSLRVKMWAKKRFGTQLKAMFDERDIESIAELVFFMLKSKADFNRDGGSGDPNQGYKDDFADLDDFFRNIVTIQDQYNIMTAVLETIGISQPILDDLKKDVENELTSESSAPRPNE